MPLAVGDLNPKAIMDIDSTERPPPPVDVDEVRKDSMNLMAQQIDHNESMVRTYIIPEEFNRIAEKLRKKVAFIARHCRSQNRRFRWAPYIL